MRGSTTAILAHARAGAAARAWALFEAGGLAERDDEPALLTLRGRLRKGLAQRLAGDARRAMLGVAAADYAAAAALRPAAYPLINAATLRLLAGDPEAARTLAGAALAALDDPAAEPDTPWWRAATRAEAALLRGDDSATAAAALAEGAAVAPQAWEDHAVTLRQLRLVLAAQGRDAAWLDRWRPPASLHYAGPLALLEPEAEVAAQIARLLDEERVGFAHGALAAGVDLLVAEAALARGAELHVVLPAPVEAFIAASVAPAGAAAVARCRAALDRATSLRCLPVAHAAPDALDFAAASLAARGAASLHAATLDGDAVVLHVANAADDLAPGWLRADRRRRSLAVTRASSDAFSAPPPTRGSLAAVVALALADRPSDSRAAPPPGSAAAQARWVAEIALPALLAESDAEGRLDGDALLLTLDAPEAALAAARRLAARWPALADGAPRLALDFGRVFDGHGPGAAFRAGVPLRDAVRLLAAAPGDSVVASEAFVLALYATAASPPPVVLLGDAALAGGATPLYAICDPDIIPAGPPADAAR